MPDEKDAIQEDVSEEKEDNNFTPPLDRNQFLEQLADAKYESEKDEFHPISYPEDPPRKESKQEVEEGEVENIQEDIQPQDQADVQPEEEEVQEEMMELIIDGAKQHVPKSKVMEAGQRSLQKAMAADKRLEEATRILNEAKQMREQKPAPAPEPEITEDDKNLFYKGLAEKVQYGSEEDVIDALKKLHTLNAHKTSGFDPNQLPGLIDQQLNVKMIQNRFNSPPDQGGFSDITSDPRLLNLASQMVNDALHKGVPNTWELYEAIGKDLRTWRTGNTAPSQNGLAAKQEKKKTIDNVRPMAAPNKQVTEHDPESMQDVIEEMRKARHQSY